MADVIVVKPKTDYDNLISASAETPSAKASPKKRVRRPNRKPLFPKTIQVHLASPADADALAKCLQRPLKADAASRRITFAATFNRATKKVIVKSRTPPSSWKFSPIGLKKYKPKPRKHWNTDWFFRQHWIDMLPFEQERAAPWLTYKVTFANEAHYACFARLVKQKLSLDTASIWFPFKEPDDYTTHWWISTDGKPPQPRYPIFIPSKGRAHEQMTMRTLSRMGLKYYVMVEPHEVELYRRLMPPEATVLSLDRSNHGDGPGYARNACWDYAKDVLKASRFFVLDDNIDGFYRLHENKRYRCGDGTPFRALEDFVDRYKNVPLAGFQYRFFKAPDHKHFPFTLNTRIYSAALVSTADPRFKQRGRYNEDTIQSLDVLSAKQCTVEFACFLSGKLRTQTMKGGNTDEFYDPQGQKARNQERSTLEKSQMVVDNYPDVCDLTFAYGRWHHKCRYEIFRGNQLKRTEAWKRQLKRQGWKSKSDDVYRMKLAQRPTVDRCFTRFA